METAPDVVFEVVDPEHPDARYCLESYFAEIDRRFDGGFDRAASLPFAAAGDMRPPAGLFLVARLDGEPVGCGALKLDGTKPAYLKRMWVAGSVRGIGLGRRLLAELEQRASLAGASAVQLETNKALVEAISLYRSAGYREVEPFNAEPHAHHWFEKRLS